jgi:DNA gyrase subunit A
VRRNTLADFANVKANGKIAMKLDEGDRLVAVATCTDANDVLMATRGGVAIRFPVEDVRVFKGRESTGVRGIRLAEGDEVISLGIINHVTFDMAERDAYLRQANALRRASDEVVTADDATEVDVSADAALGTLDAEAFQRLADSEEFILTVTENGYGKRTSAYEYRVTGRGGQGVAAIDMSERNGPVIAAFPVSGDDQIMLISDSGQLIRMPIHDVRIAGRKTQGVTLFRTTDGEKVVAAAWLPADDNPDENSGQESVGEDDVCIGDETVETPETPDIS